MKTGRCQLCNYARNLVKAHIIPRSFCLKVKGTSKQLLEARSHDIRDVKDWQNGVWDDAILCAECESGFGSWDKYGFELLGNPPGSNVVPQIESELQHFILHNIDYERLKLFLLSMLWRASVSSQPFFSRIKLGKFESLLGEMIRAQNPGKWEEFPIVVTRIIDHPLPNALLPPYRHRSPEGINFNMLFLPSIKIMVKVDRRPIPREFEPVCLRPQPENIIVPLPVHQNELSPIRTGAEIFKRWCSK